HIGLAGRRGGDRGGDGDVHRAGARRAGDGERGGRGDVDGRRVGRVGPEVDGGGPGEVGARQGHDRPAFGRTEVTVDGGDRRGVLVGEVVGPGGRRGAGRQRHPGRGGHGDIDGLDRPEHGGW